MNKFRVSILMTAFNGEKYVGEQIASIVNSMGPRDELIISDDGSTDGTKNVIQEHVEKDNRIAFFDGPGKGLNENMRFLLSKARGEFVFISDQDDLWYPNKIETVLNTFNENPSIQVIHHDSDLIDENGAKTGKTVYQTISFSKNIIKFFFKSHIFGSMTAFRRSFMAYDFVPKKNCYDAGIACFGIRLKSIMFINDCLMGYRRHSNNMSSFKRRKLSIIIKERFHLLNFILFNVVFLRKNKLFMK